MRDCQLTCLFPRHNSRDGQLCQGVIGKYGWNQTEKPSLALHAALILSLIPSVAQTELRRRAPCPRRRVAPARVAGPGPCCGFKGAGGAESARGVEARKAGLTRARGLRHGARVCVRVRGTQRRGCRRQRSAQWRAQAKRARGARLARQRGCHVEETGRAPARAAECLVPGRDAHALRGRHRPRRQRRAVRRARRARRVALLRLEGAHGTRLEEPVVLEEADVRHAQGDVKGPRVERRRAGWTVRARRVRRGRLVLALRALDARVERAAVRRVPLHAQAARRGDRARRRHTEGLAGQAGRDRVAARFLERARLYIYIYVYI